MRKPNLTKWNDDDGLQGLLIFAQALNELLFDYTLDSFKTPALNLHLSIMEVRVLVSQLVEGRLKEGALSFCVEELEYHLKNDPVIPRPIPHAWQECFGKIKDLKANPKKIFDLIDALLIDVGKKYWDHLKVKLREAVRDPNKKKKIISLAKAFAAEIELRGFSQRYAYFANKRFFFTSNSSPERIERPEQLDVFLNLFERNSRPRSVAFRASNDFIKFKDYSEPFRITIQDTPPPIENPGLRTQGFIGSSADFPLFFIVKDIRAKDEHYACSRAKLHAEFFTDVCRFSNHTATLSLSSASLIMENDNQYTDVIEAPPNPMTCNYRRQENEDDFSTIQKAIEILSGAHFSPALRHKFTKVLEYHEAALTAKTLENQLLNLWSALEGFLPPPDQKTVRINHYLASLIPVLTVTYVSKVFGYVSDCLFNHSEDIKNLINSISSEDTFSLKTTAMLTCEEFESERRDLCNLLLDNRLLLYRCFWCYQSFSNTKVILKNLEAHKKKIEWHIKRIYTTRNLIVHSAQSLPYLNSLVENLHSYIDTLVNYIVKTGVSSEMPAQLGGVLALCALEANALENHLKGEVRNCTVQNYQSFLFGTSSDN